MKTLLKNAIIIDAESQYHFQQKDVLISKGIVEKIDNLIDTKSLFLLINFLFVQKS